MIYLSSTQAANAAKAPEEASSPAQSVLLSGPDVEVWLPGWLKPYWDFLATYPVVLLPVLVLLAYGVGRAIQAFFSRFVHKLTRRTPSEFDDQLVGELNHPIMPTTIILALLIGINYLTLPEFLQNLTIRLLYMILLIIWTGAAMKVAHIILEMLSGNRSRFRIVQQRTIPAFDMALKIVVVGASAYLFMLIWGIDPTAWLASAGVIGIAVGFAARDTLANFFSGIFIIADAPYKIGDYIVLDTGERGMVKQLGMRSTRLLTRDDIEVTIPNAVMGNAKIINETGGPHQKRRVRVQVGVAYGSDVDHVTRVLERCAENQPGVTDDPAPRVRFRRFGDSSLDFELLVWIDEPVLRGRVLHRMNATVYKAFEAEGISIPFPQRDVWMRREPEA